MENKNLFLFVVLAVAALFVIESFSDKDILSGRTVDRGVMTCSDSDGLNIHTKGFVTTNIGGDLREYPDRCSGGGGVRVLENYCDGNSRAFTYEWCDNGEICNDGRCVRDTSSRYF